VAQKKQNNNQPTLASNPDARHPNATCTPAEQKKYKNNNQPLCQHCTQKINLPLQAIRMPDVLMAPWVALHPD